MKKYICKLYFLLLLPFLAGLSSCKDEATLVGEIERPSSQEEEVYYFPIRLNLALVALNSDGEEFDYGDKTETMLAPGAHHYAIFYDQESKIVELTSLEGSQYLDNSQYNDNYTLMIARTMGRPVETAKEYFFKLKECLVLLNTDITEEDIQELSLSELLNARVGSPWIYVDGVRYFTMCNAVFVNNGKLDYSSKVKFNEDNYEDYFFKDNIAATEAARKGNAAFEVYVERLAAKFQLDIEINSGGLTQVVDNTFRIYAPNENKLFVLDGFNGAYNSPQYVSDKYDYQVKITGWGLNAWERESNLFRKVQTNGGYFTNWNDPARNRCYWSEDVHYSHTDYPRQYRLSVDESLNYYALLEENNFLKNFSYNDFFQEDNLHRYAAYSPENTYNFDLSYIKQSMGEKANIYACTHLIVCAEMLTKFKGDTYEPNDVYRDRNGIFYKNATDMFKALVTQFNEDLKTHSRMKFTNYNWDGSSSAKVDSVFSKGEFILCYKGNKLTKEYLDKLTDINIEDFSSQAQVKNGDGQIILWNDDFTIVNEKNEALQIVNSITSDKYGEEVPNYRSTKMSSSEMKSLVYEWMGAIDHFKDGKMYYAVPIVFQSPDQNPDISQTIYAVVRNCSYRFSVNNITGLGISVDNPDQPIIPQEVSSSDKFFVGVELLDWHKISETVSGAIN